MRKNAEESMRMCEEEGSTGGGGGNGGVCEDDQGGGAVLIRIHVPDLNIHKCLQFYRHDLVWDVKQQCLASLPKVNFYFTHLVSTFLFFRRLTNSCSLCCESKFVLFGDDILL